MKLKVTIKIDGGKDIKYNIDNNPGEIQKLIKKSRLFGVTDGKGNYYFPHSIKSIEIDKVEQTIGPIQF